MAGRRRALDLAILAAGAAILVGATWSWPFEDCDCGISGRWTPMRSLVALRVPSLVFYVPVALSVVAAALGLASRTRTATPGPWIPTAYVRRAGFPGWSPPPPPSSRPRGLAPALGRAALNLSMLVAFLGSTFALGEHVEWWLYNGSLAGALVVLTALRLLGDVRAVDDVPQW